MRVAVVDIGTNSTRLLVADVRRGAPARQLVRHSEVTRLGEGVDKSGALMPRAIDRTLAVLAHYRAEIDAHGCERNLAVLTSAVRDAKNGVQLVRRVREQVGLDARVLSGEEEARLMFTGVMSGRAASSRAATPESQHDDAGASAPRDARGASATVVIDIGGGSTEIVIGNARELSFHVSLQAGVVRMSERHLRSDPAAANELDSLARDARAIIAAGTASAPRGRVGHGIAVAGTATSAAAIAQRLDPYDPERVHGFTLPLATVEHLAERLAGMDEAARRSVVGLHPDRAPTIVAGMALLREAMRRFGLATVEVSEHDLLMGGAVLLASNSRPAPRG